MELTANSTLQKRATIRSLKSNKSLSHNQLSNTANYTSKNCARYRGREIQKIEDEKVNTFFSLIPWGAIASATCGVLGYISGLVYEDVTRNREIHFVNENA